MKQKSNLAGPVQAGVTMVALTIAGALGLLVAPPDALQGDVQRLMYVHVPAAWVAYLAFAVTAVASLLYLVPRTRSPRLDRLAAASAEVGVVFTALAIALGALWGRAVWGVWWTWDARLVTTVVLLFLYLGYLAFRTAVPDVHLRAKRSAIVALIAFIDVPIVHLSVVWWRTLHQQATVLNPELDPQIHGAMAWALLASVIAFTMLYGLLVRLRTGVARLEARRDEDALAKAVRDRVGPMQLSSTTRGVIQ